ncbi:MAG: phosphoribosylformylglycinamidine cyclo-ligase, partial [Bacillota bacterium]|nr:phosphoribosylformylglycinamidine cyclo-ligase [Bacillota bacterium]
MDYRQAGVNIDAGEEAVERIKGMARSTFRPEVLHDIG